MGDDILNMSLDDIIKNKGGKAGAGAGGGMRKKGRGDARGGKAFEARLRVTGTKGRGAKSGRGRARVIQVERGPPLREAPRNEEAVHGDAAWEHDLYEDGPSQRPRRVRPAQQGFKLLITNLDFKVTDDDIRELFENCGPVVKAGVIYDRSGRSEEAAEVTFQRREDAVAAMKRYNNLALDNKPMKIELVEGGAADRGVLSSGIRIGGGGASTAPFRPQAVQRPARGLRRPVTQPRNSGRGKQARGRGPVVSQADLDKDLDSYMATDA